MEMHGFRNSGNMGSKNMMRFAALFNQMEK
jgi:hypothetical protein